MKLKNILLVVALLAVLSGISLVLNKKKPPADEADPRVNQPLVSDAAISAATGVRLSEGGKTVLLKKTGDTWTVASYHDLPADFPKLARFVQDLTAAKVTRFVTANPERLKGLEFKDTKIALLDATGHPLVAITLGKNAEGGGRFLRFGDEAKAYLAPLDTWLDLEPKNWADSELTHFSADEVKQVSLGFAAGAAPEVFTRTKKGEPFNAEKLPDGKKVKASVISGLLEKLGGVRFTDVAATNDPAARSAREHARTVTVTTFDGKIYTISAGREPGRTVAVDPGIKPGNSGPETVVGPVIGKEKTESAQAGPAAIAGGPVVKNLPPGPVFVFVTTSVKSDRVNAMMKTQAFKADEALFTGLPATADDCFEAVPAKAKP